MAINFDILLLAQIVVYVGIFITGFAISIPLGVTTIHFKGLCVLFTRVEQKYLYSGSLANCNFPIASSVLLCIFYALGMIVYYGYYLLKRDRNVRFQMWVMPFILIYAAITLVMFINGCLISIGFRILCDQLASYYAGSVKTCSDAQNWQWLKDANTSDFFTLLSASQVAVWISFLLWAVQLSLSILLFVRMRRLQLQQQDQTSSVCHG